MKLTIACVVVFLGCLGVTLGKKNCNKPCTADWKPVCGSDGNTYGNKCMFEGAKCRDSKLRIKHKGECKNPCPQACTMEYMPVCGTDGKTYSNECVFNSEHCNDSITIAKRRAC